MTNEQVMNVSHPWGNFEDGDKRRFINKDSVDKDNKAGLKDKLAPYMEQKGFKPRRELFRQFINQKIIRAYYSNNQLQEVLTDFWFNHFNVSIIKNDCAAFIPTYEGDVIRRNAIRKI